MAFRAFLLVIACWLVSTDDVLQAQDAPFVGGYQRDVVGEVLSYWSFHPFAKTSLLTRTTTGTMTISWETQAVPPAIDRAPVRFLWIGAYSTGTSSSDHTFDLVISGRDTISFKTRKGGVREDWTASSTRGATLAFKHVWSDHVNDAHGYFTLTVPPAFVVPGQPLQLAVTGRASASRDWYMTFRYAVRESALVRSLPFLVRDSGRLRQPVEVSIDAPFMRGSATVALAGSAPSVHPLTLGWNSIEVLTDEVTTATALPVEISINQGEPRHQIVSVRPVSSRTIYLLPHSHNDIGYSDLQTTVSRIQHENLRDAIRLAEVSRDYPEGSQFRWNVEILWPIDSLLKRGSREEIGQFVDAVRRGEIGLNALGVNPLTGISRPEALMHLTDIARTIRRTAGLEVRSAMISDIPGMSWGFVPALAQAGVRYLSNGPNSGDRIGHFGVAWGDKPFWWRSPSGKDSLLVWVAGTGYSMFHATRTLRANDGFRLKLTDYLERLDATGYPYELVQMRYSIYSDNGMTDSTMSDFVREWNARTVSPVLRISTTDEMFDHFERRYGSSLPSFSGDITPVWEDGAASTAAELGTVLRASDSLVMGEILASMDRARPDVLRSFDDAWDAVNLWNEHTWGAWNSVSDPDHPEAVKQWEMKQAYAVAAHHRTEEILSSGPGRLSGTSEIEVVNTSTWERTDLVTVSPDKSRTGDRVLDEDGKPVVSQRLTTGELAFRADHVPPLSAKRYRIVRGNGPANTALRASGSTLSDLKTILTIDTSSGAISSMRDVMAAREFVRTEGTGVNAVLYVNGVEPARTIPVQLLRHGLKESGPLVISYVTEGVIADRGSVRREVRLIEGIDRIEMLNTIDKRPVREKEAFYFAFDLEFDAPTTRMDVGWGVVRPELDQLPGSCKDYFSVQRWVDVSNGRGGMVWATAEAPLVALGGPVDEQRHNEGPSGWKTTAVSSGAIFSYVMNNYWHTNYKADQSGLSQYRYALRAHGGYDPVAAYRFGVEWTQPLLVRFVSRSTPPPSLPFMLTSDMITATSIRPARDGQGWVVRLYNPSPTPAAVSIDSRNGKLKAAFRSSLHEERGRPLYSTVTLSGFEVLTVRIEERR